MKNEKLIKLISDNGLKLNFIAKKLGLERTSLYKKLHGKSKFNPEEITTLVNILHIPSREVGNIFFNIE